MNETKTSYRVLEGDCLKILSEGSIQNVDLTFLDPPYRQGKDYRFFDDNQPEETYWNWLKQILSRINETTTDGGAIYFMQREKNVEWMVKVLRETGWTFQNLIIWKKFTSAVPCDFRFGKQHQVIVFATKGENPRVFNKLRVDYPLRPEYKYKRSNGIYLTDVWDDIKELTSGYFAGDEAIRNGKRERVHIQQSPIALLLRIILSSSLPGDTVLDPMAGSGTAVVVAHQLSRRGVAIEIDPEYVKLIETRLKYSRPSDNVMQYYDYYRFTPNLKEVWPSATRQQRIL